MQSAQPTSHYTEDAQRADDSVPNNNRKPSRVPGDSPNKQNAQRRKGQRPKTKNSPPGQKIKLQIPWAEPATDVKALETNLSPNATATPAGVIDIHNDSVARIAEDHADTFYAITQTTSTNEEFAKKARDKLFALTFFKAARQLYATMTSADQSSLSALKPIVNDTAEIPAHMAAAISMYGSFDSTFGRIQFKDDILTFRRWIAAGLSMDPESDYRYRNDVERIPLHVQSWKDTLKMVWQDYVSKYLIDTLIDKLMEQFREPFNINVNGHAYRVTIERYDPQSNVDFISTVPENAPHFNKIVKLMKLRQLEPDLFVKGMIPRKEPILTNENPKYVNISQATDEDLIEYRETLDLLGLTAAPSFLDDNYMRTCYIQSSRSYYNMYKPFFLRHLTLVPAPFGNHGLPAQLVSSRGIEAEWPLPLSDADAALGYLYSPCQGFIFHPKFEAFGRIPNNIAASEFAQRDLKTK